MQKKILGNLFAFPLRKRKRKQIPRISFVIVSVRMVVAKISRIVRLGCPQAVESVRLKRHSCESVFCILPQEIRDVRSSVWTHGVAWRGCQGGHNGWNPWWLSSSLLYPGDHCLWLKKVCSSISCRDSFRQAKPKKADSRVGSRKKGVVLELRVLVLEKTPSHEKHRFCELFLIF